MKNLLFMILFGACVVSASAPVGKQTAAKVVGGESLIALDSRMLYSSFVNNSPGDGMRAEVNPPRFRWFYVPDPLELTAPIRPMAFRFQVADNKAFADPIVDVRTEINFYNELAPFPEGKTYYWRVGYIPHGKNEPTAWTKVFSVYIPVGTPQWDRSMLRDPDFGGHPRLLFRKDQLPALRKMAADDPVFRNMVAVAEEMRQHKWWNGWPKDDRTVPEFTRSKTERNKYLWQICRKLSQTAFVYRVTGDERYKNILDIWTTIAAYPKGGPASPEGMGNGYAESEDNTSITEYIACVYDWFYDELTPEQRKIFEQSLEWRIKAWMYEFRWGGALYRDGENDPKIGRSSIAIAGSGHSWEGAMDTFPAAIALYEKSAAARTYFHWMANYMIGVGELIAQNGGYDLGAHYGQSHMKWLVYQLLYLNSALPELQLGANPLYQQYADFFVGLAPIGLQTSHFGRISPHGAGMAMRREIFNLLAFLTGNGEVLYNWLNLGGNSAFSWRQWVHVAAPLQFKGELQPVPSEKTNFVFPATGFVMVHKYSPYGKKAFRDGVGVMTCCRPYPGDEYNNENTFQIYAYGQALNYGGHSGDENPYGFQTIAHNTIMVDGIGQTITQESRRAGYRGVLLAYKEGDNYTYWMGDATNAYPRRTEIARHGGWSSKTQIDYDDTLFGEKGAPKLERFRRHFLFMRDKYLVIYDDLKTAPERPSRFSWRYRVLPKTDVIYHPESGRLTYTLGDVQVILQHIASPQGLEFLDLQDLDQYKNPITGMDYLQNKWVARDMKRADYRKKVCRHNFWFTTKEPHSDYHFLTVVYPVQPGTAPPVITRLDDYTVKVEKDGDTDIISFDKETKFPATLIVDLEALRQPVSF